MSLPIFSALRTLPTRARTPPSLSATPLSAAAMSTPARGLHASAIRSGETPTSRTVSEVVYAAERPEGMNAVVRRSIGTKALRNLTPFLILDHAQVPPGAGFPDHPHRGMTTVTYMLSGRLTHEDFTGSVGELGPGDLQWMTAGRGIMHSEIPKYADGTCDLETAVKNGEEIAEAVQLWIDMPYDQKYMEPFYQDRKAADVKTAYPSPGVSIGVISGESHGVHGCVQPVGGCWYFDIRLSKPGAEVFQELPAGWTAFAYILSGSLQVGDSEPIDVHNTVVLSNDCEEGVRLSRPATADPNGETRLVLIAGEPLDQGVFMMGTFVTATQKEAKQALEDWKQHKNGFERADHWHSKTGALLRKAYAERLAAKDPRIVKAR